MDQQGQAQCWWVFALPSPSTHTKPNAPPCAWCATPLAFSSQSPIAALPRNKRKALMRPFIKKQPQRTRRLVKKLGAERHRECVGYRYRIHTERCCRRSGTTRNNSCCSPSSTAAATPQMGMLAHMTLLKGAQRRRERERGRHTTTTAPQPSRHTNKHTLKKLSKGFRSQTPP